MPPESQIPTTASEKRRFAVRLALFYSAIATPFCLFVMRGFFSTIAREIEEAARLDGASSWAVLWRILMPLARGPIAVLVLFQFT